jgi:hypothetical protein
MWRDVSSMAPQQEIDRSDDLETDFFRAHGPSD